MPALTRVLFVAAMLTTSVARADNVQTCVDASERGQKAQRAGQLVDARATYLECVADRCPAIVKSSCSQWLDQVNASLPSVVVAATDDAHHDILAARVTIDKKPITLGRAVQVDPGPHVVDASAAGYDAGTESIVARENEHGRAITLVLPRHVATPSSPPPVDVTKKEGRSVRPVTWLTGSLAVAGLASFTTFAVIGRSQATDLRSTCAPRCSESDRDVVHTKYVIADISLIAAIILGGVSVITFLTTPSVASSP